MSNRIAVGMLVLLLLPCCGKPSPDVLMGGYKRGMTITEVAEVLGYQPKVESASIEYGENPTQKEYRETPEFLIYDKDNKLYLEFNHFKKLIRVSRATGPNVGAQSNNGIPSPTALGLEKRPSPKQESGKAAH